MTLERRGQVICSAIVVDDLVGGIAVMLAVTFVHSHPVWIPDSAQRTARPS